MKVEENIDSLIPDQYQGSRMDAEQRRSSQNVEEAIRIYRLGCERLLNVNRWGSLAGVSAFQLISPSGIRIEREAKQGDYIRIDLPGPGTMAGMGYDWVKIEQIKSFEREDEHGLAMTVRPSAHPVSGSTEIAHFLKDIATSTFIIRRSGNEVFAEEHGRNEVANTDAQRLLDKGRNFAVGIAAKLGLSYPQWKILVKAFLAD